MIKYTLQELLAFIQKFYENRFCFVCILRVLHENNATHNFTSLDYFLWSKLKSMIYVNIP